MVCARLNFFKIFIFIFSPRRSRRGTLGISSPGGPVEEPLKPFCSFFSLRRLSSSVVFQWGSLRQTLDLSKTTNEKVPWRRPSNNAAGARLCQSQISMLCLNIHRLPPLSLWSGKGCHLPESSNILNLDRILIAHLTLFERSHATSATRAGGILHTHIEQ